MLETMTSASDSETFRLGLKFLWASSTDPAKPTWRRVSDSSCSAFIQDARVVRFKFTFMQVLNAYFADTLSLVARAFCSFYGVFFSPPSHVAGLPYPLHVSFLRFAVEEVSQHQFCSQRCSFHEVVVLFAVAIQRLFVGLVLEGVPRFLITS